MSRFSRSFPPSFAKLEDGSWGIRSAEQRQVGEVLTVVTRDGKRQQVTIKAKVGFNSYGDSLWSLVPREAPAQVEAQVGSLSGVLALFDKAKTHLKRPAIVLQVPEVNLGVRLTIAGPKAKVPGSLTVTTSEYTTSNDYGEPARDWLGRILVDGTYQPARAANGRADAIVRRLAELARDPAKVAAEHGKLTGKCCFCNRALSDERSTAVGYGQTCAGHYGVAWGGKPATFAGEAV